MSDKRKGRSLFSRFPSLKGYCLVGPAVILLGLFTLYPIGYLFYSAMLDGSLLSKKRNFIGLSNYVTLLSNDFGTVLANTILYSIGWVTLTMVFALLLAVFLNSKSQQKLNNLTMAAIFTPHIISLVSVSSVFLWIMDPQVGIINYVLRTLGLPPFPFLSSSKTALFSLILMMVWKSVGFYTLLIMSALQTVPKELYEAADLDNASKTSVFFRITIPMISPTLFFTAIVATINSFQVFETVNLMTQGGPVNSTNTLVYKIYSDAFKYLKLGQASAEAVVLLLFVAVLTIIYFAVLSRKVFYR